MSVANSSTAISGRLGKAVIDDTLTYRLTQWTFNPSTSESAWGDSNSEGYTVRARARMDGTGSVTAKLDTARYVYSMFMPGDIGKLVLWQDATLYWVMTRVLFSNLTLTFDQDSQEVVEWSCDFGCDGPYYYPGQTGATVETLPTS